MKFAGDEGGAHDGVPGHRRLGRHVASPHVLGQGQFDDAADFLTRERFHAASMGQEHGGMKEKMAFFPVATLPRAA
jgi:hypothetical protein